MISCTNTHQNSFFFFLEVSFSYFQKKKKKKEKKAAPFKLNVFLSILCQSFY